MLKVIISPQRAVLLLSENKACVVNHLVHTEKTRATLFQPNCRTCLLCQVRRVAGQFLTWTQPCYPTTTFQMQARDYSFCKVGTVRRRTNHLQNTNHFNLAYNGTDEHAGNWLALDIEPEGIILEIVSFPLFVQTRWVENFSKILCFNFPLDTSILLITKLSIVIGHPRAYFFT